MMCSLRVLLMWSTMAASVVDLPLPVGPVTSTRPFDSEQKSTTARGSLSSSAVRIFDGIWRKTALGPRWSRKMLARKRATPSSS